MVVERFTSGKLETQRKLNLLVDAVKSLQNLNGDVFIRTANTPAGTTVRLNIAAVLERIMKNSGGGGLIEVCKMSLSGTQNAPANLLTQITLDTIIYDDTSGGDIANNRINITSAGLYAIIARAAIAHAGSAGVATSFAFTTRGGGTGFNETKFVDGNALDYFSLVEIKKLTTSDYIELWITNYDPVINWSIISGTAGTLLSVVKLF